MDADKRRFKRRYVALHESAHAVAHILTDRPFAGVSIVPDATSFGRVWYRPDQENPTPKAGTDRRIVSAWLFIGLAGRVFHCEALPLPQQPCDTATVAGWCRLCSGDIEPAALLGRALQAAHRWFCRPENRVPVEALADELMRQRELSAEDARIIALRTGCGQKSRVSCSRSIGIIWRSPEQRSAIARTAAVARWGKKSDVHADAHAKRKTSG